MKTRTRSIEQIIEEQMQRWQIMRTEKAEVESEISIVTISREPGSGGRIVAQRLAADLGFEVFHQEVIHMIADDAKISKKLLESLDEKGLTVLEDWISSLVYDRHLWPDQYLKHLMKVIMTIGKHGHAVIVGRGANFVLPTEKRFSVRIVLPRDERIRNVAQNFDIPPEEARRRVIRTESDRRAFIRKYFNADIADPINYNLIINMAALSIEEAANVIVCASGIKTKESQVG